MEDTLRGSIDSLLEGVQLMAPDWRYLCVNPAAADHAGGPLDVTERERKRTEVRRLELDVQRQRLQVFRATMTTVNDIVNNFLNSLQFVRLEAEDDRLSADMLTTFDEIIRDTAEKLRRLGELQSVREKEMAMGTGIDYDPGRP